MKYYFYLDETGDHGLSFVDQNFPLFLLAGCLFDENELMKMEAEIGEFKIEFFGTTEVILHSREIRKCEGAFQILFDIEKKKKFYYRLNEIMKKRKFTIIGSGVNKDRHIKKYGKGAKDPYVISLAFIIERLIFYLDKVDNNAIVDIRIEKRGKREDQQLLDQYNTILDTGTYFVSSDRIKRRIESFESFYKKDNINGLQVADLCAYPLARHVLNSEEPYIPFEIIKDKIYCDNLGKYDGYGLKIFP
ncbi:MAG: DUF3800 domain-containing protein [Candidatus Moranbacteria bacterium CG_4_9_14_3_um_filter_40_7]|nr:MAG: hypothetical protein COX31_00595 [Candidatus Moranbacteria bacterium CG23_combo_of_CG06-09_8_20_14_all_40_16]PIU80404.1 MAG: DUF3800 domain-containing protein [Candidatus Moranbacteria bacterium CG06_land_8_20_14_3_00_40_12]PJA87556.1 MAG: DUF3800 domain-containing protein [Candidatus Moranbacteria bacterium CG_4_9_14_3_um_filter_40_7]